MRPSAANPSGHRRRSADERRLRADAQLAGKDTAEAVLRTDIELACTTSSMRPASAWWASRLRVQA